jgi:hypothetical protein
VIAFHRVGIAAIGLHHRAEAVVRSRILKNARAACDRAFGIDELSAVFDVPDADGERGVDHRQG